jgi:hypothetical protein
MINKIKNRINCYKSKIISKWYGRIQKQYYEEISFTGILEKFPTRNDWHAYAHHYFHNFINHRLKLHRNYFNSQGRGFGEDAFHAMLFLLFQEFKPVSCLEIGVFRGQTVSLFCLISEILNYQAEVYGISPFTNSGDAVSVYKNKINYFSDTVFNCNKFNLNPPKLIKALSTDQEATEFIKSKKWDLIYIDGNHDYEVALSDYLICRDSLSVGGILVLDDSSLYTDFHPPVFSFAGHPGPSCIVNELAIKELKFIGAVGHNNVFRKI